ncbi:LytTR family DNA-binding domain-containing protein [Marvinbryantia sp.]|uniref:LytR/AlgR family response regulator transcription factor n=1 Tax=Marvinbryantia sp. TaxID=2496532 RepID=UPI002803DA79|nr:LytTR family DNA-binding domain-containing protein [uncultured Marvinbryantia sp.]
MVSVAIVEDDPGYTKRLREYLKKYEEEYREPLQVTAYSDGDEIVENYRGQFDLILMDIEMRFMDGMAAAEQIRKQDSRVIIIFITNMAQYAIRGYAVDALDYVLKPISYFAFSQRIRRAMGRMKKREEHYVAVNTKNGVYKIPASQLYWVESQGHRLTYHTKDAQYESTTASIGKLEKELGSANFFRCNKCYLINLRFVTGIEKDDVLLGDKNIPVSRAKKSDLKKALVAYMGEAMK